ncbi:MAG: hypothetical protein R3258_09540 [Acidimicrobiia bacterium]|nr:hypothetical protein [Acidimicrobiia bacterium]
MQIQLTVETLEEWALVAAAAVVVVSLFYLLMAFGWRRGEFVWGGRHPRRLPPDLRRLSFLFGLLLVVAAAILALLSGELGAFDVPDELTSLIPSRFDQSASFILTVFFGITGLYRLGKGAPLERFLFAPILIAAAVISGLLGFA